MPSAVRQDMELWIGCVAGALEEREYASKLKAAGFADVDVDVWRVYDTAALAAQSGQAGGDAQPSDGSEANGQFASAFIRATKPARGCCGPDCCA